MEFMETLQSIASKIRTRARVAAPAAAFLLLSIAGGCGSETPQVLAQNPSNLDGNGNSGQAEGGTLPDDWNRNSGQVSGAIGGAQGQAGGIGSNPFPIVTPFVPPARKWKAVLMTGDDSITAFDKARRRLNSLIQARGIPAGNVRELSMSAREQGGNVLPSSSQNLENALASLQIGQNDGCFLFFTSHGSQQGFYLKGQSTLSPVAVDGLLTRHCSNVPTVLLVSACYSGVFTDPVMQKPNRIILTAARRDRTSFGCGVENEYTFWDNCLIDHFQQGQDWKGVYSQIQSCITAKEAGGMTPSLPQAFFGASVGPGIFAN